jgi:hypothetical protein
MARQQVRLVTYAWGRHHVDDLLDYALSAVLAPGNLPALAAVYDCSVVILTEEKLFGYVQAHPTTHRLKAICPLRLITLDDLVSEPWQYGMTLTQCLFRGFADLGPAMTETYMLFLNADFILADGCYERLLDHIRRGERALLSPSYCVAENALRRSLRERRICKNGALVIPARKMAELILRNMHKTLRSKIVNQTLWEFEYTDQFYWKIDPHTLIGHQMPIALVGMRPERHLTDINAFWDWGIVYDFCPSKQLTVLGDSDEFLMMELRADDRSIDHVRVGRSSSKELAHRTVGYITQYQVDNARFPLTLHSNDVPDLESARRSLANFVEGVLRHLPSDPIDHRDHFQWKYHKRHFWDRLEGKIRRRRSEEIKAAIEKIKRNWKRERSILNRPGTADHKLLLKQLRKRTTEKLKSLEQDLTRLQQDRANLSVYYRYIQLLNPYRAAHRRAKQLIRPMAHDRVLNILAVCAQKSELLASLKALPGCHIRLSAASILDGALRLLPRDSPKFGLCLIELSEYESIRARELFEGVLEKLSKDGKIIICWHDHGFVPLKTARIEIVNFIFNHMSETQVTSFYGGSWFSVQASTLAGLQVRSRRRPIRAIFRIAYLIAGAVLGLLADVRERMRRRESTGEPRHCSTMVIEIDFLSAPPSPSQMPVMLEMNTQAAPVQDLGCESLVHSS